jgi:hypothetical protein
MADESTFGQRYWHAAAGHDPAVAEQAFAVDYQPFAVDEN